MHEVDEDEDGVPEEGVEGAEDDPAPKGEEHAADGEGDAQVEDAVDAVGRQVREEKEDVCELEVDVVDWQPVVADAELPVIHSAKANDVADVVGCRWISREESCGGGVGGCGGGGGYGSRRRCGGCAGCATGGDAG